MNETYFVQNKTKTKVIEKFNFLLIIHYSIFNFYFQTRNKLINKYFTFA